MLGPIGAYFGCVVVRGTLYRVHARIVKNHAGDHQAGSPCICITYAWDTIVERAELLMLKRDMAHTIRVVFRSHPLQHNTSNGSLRVQRF